MKPTEPLPLHHSWPLAESGQRFALGLVHGGSGPASAEATTTGAWTCALPDDALTWSDAVYDIFGLPRGTAVPACENGRTVRLHGIEQDVTAPYR